MRLFGVAEAVRHEIGVLDSWQFQPRRVASLATSRRALGEVDADTAFAAGQGLTLAVAVELATAVAEAIRAGPTAELVARPAHGLTDREVEVLRLVTTCRSDREIGEVLYISPRTVSRHLQSIFGKLGVNSRTAAAAAAHRLGLA